MAIEEKDMTDDFIKNYKSIEKIKKYKIISRTTQVIHTNNNFQQKNILYSRN